jgi:hypothetical protein
MNPKTVAASLSLSFLLMGCASYYKVSDPTTGKTYFTKDLDRHGRSGAVSFKDGATGSKVTVQNSEVTKIDRSAYKAGAGK